MPKVYFIIVTFNAMKWVDRCFSSLRKSSISLSCIVVDNGSTDGTQEYIKTNFPEVDFIQSEENLGFGKANNIGIEKAYKLGADFFYLMNQDAWVFEDSVQKLLEVYNNYPRKEELGILSPMHIDGSEKKLDIFLDKYIANNFENRIISDFYFNTFKSFYEINFINAAHWFLPKDTIVKVGGFNPYFFHYGEDNEYVNRIFYHEKKILLCTKSKAVHDGIQDLGKVNYNKFVDTTIDTKILNPNYINAEKHEIKSLRKSIFKNKILGNFEEGKKLSQELKRLQNMMPELLKLKNTLGSSKHPFLNL